MPTESDAEPWACRPAAAGRTNKFERRGLGGRSTYFRLLKEFKWHDRIHPTVESTKLSSPTVRLIETK